MIPFRVEGASVTRNTLATLTLLAALLTTGGIGTARGAGAEPTGVIDVEVRYQGVPQVETVKVGKDVEQCGRETKVEKIAVGPGKGLANAVVSVAGLTGPRTGKKPVLDQRGCAFRPHVVGMQTGEIDLVNSDGILHNVHTYSTANPPINKAQPKFKKTMTERFDKPEIVKITCDIHSWMLGWIAVMPHPFFGVTDASGMTRIENVPAGKHAVDLWHETLGKQRRDVEVRAGQTTRVTFDIGGRR